MISLLEKLETEKRNKEEELARKRKDEMDSMLYQSEQYGSLYGGFKVEMKGNIWESRIPGAKPLETKNAQNVPIVVNDNLQPYMNKRLKDESLENIPDIPIIGRDAGPVSYKGRKLMGFRVKASEPRSHFMNPNHAELAVKETVVSKATMTFRKLLEERIAADPSILLCGTDMLNDAVITMLDVVVGF